MRSFRLPFALLLISLLCLTTGQARGQRQIWSESFSYMLCQGVALDGERAITLMPHCALDYNAATGQAQRLSTCTTLSEADPTAAAIDEKRNCVAIGHLNGVIDIICNENTTRYTSLSNPLLPEPQNRINALAINGEMLYAAQGDRLYEIDLRTLDISDQKRVWADGNTLHIHSLFRWENRLYVGANQGVVSFTIPFREQREMVTVGTLTLPALQVARCPQSGHLVAICQNGSGREIHAWDGSAWRAVPLHAGEPNSLVATSQHLYCAAGYCLLQYAGGNLERAVYSIPSSSAGGVMAGWQNRQGRVFVALRRFGLNEYHDYGLKPLSPRSPSFHDAGDILALGDDVVFIPGLPDSDAPPVPFRLFYRTPRQGETIGIPEARNAACLIALDADQQHFLAGSSLDGLYEFHGTRLMAHYHSGNSVLQADARGTSVTGGFVASDGTWWLYSPSTPQSLITRSPAGEWRTYPFPGPKPHSTLRFDEDKKGRIWIGHPQTTHLVCIEPETFASSHGAGGYDLYLCHAISGKMPQAIYDFAINDDDKIWIVLDRGIVYAPNVSFLTGGRGLNLAIFSTTLETLGNPIHYVMGEPEFQTMLSDHGGNVWAGLARGGLLHLKTEEQAVKRVYNVDNSPLPSPIIRKLALTSRSGELWIATDKGALCLKTDSQMPADDYSRVIVYPNPVRPGYSGLITIDGLKEGTVLKITDAAGTLAQELLSSGGRAQWDGKNGLGNPVKSGVYLIFLTDREGKQTHVEKLVIVR